MLEKLRDKVGSLGESADALLSEIDRLAAIPSLLLAMTNFQRTR